MGKMTLDEKIAHLDDDIRYHEGCMNEYIQLRDWLKELKTYKEQQQIFMGNGGRGFMGICEAKQIRR